MHTCIGCLIVWLAHKNIENWYERRPNNNNDNQSVKCTKRVQGDIWCVDKGSPFVPCLPCPFVLSFYPFTYCLSQVDPLHFLFLFFLFPITVYVFSFLLLYDFLSFFSNFHNRREDTIIPIISVFQIGWKIFV